MGLKKKSQGNEKKNHRRESACGGETKCYERTDTHMHAQREGRRRDGWGVNYHNVRQQRQNEGTGKYQPRSDESSHFSFFFSRDFSHSTITRSFSLSLPRFPPLVPLPSAIPSLSPPKSCCPFSLSSSFCLLISPFHCHLFPSLLSRISAWRKMEGGGLRF